MSENVQQGEQSEPGEPERSGQSPQLPPRQGPVSTGGFDFNRPTIVSLLYLASPVLGITALVGVVLAYVWRGEPHGEWESSHFQYLITTFWLALVGSIVSVMLMMVLIGFLLLAAVWVLVIIRCVLSLVNAQKQLPMPNPATWLA